MPSDEEHIEDVWQYRIEQAETDIERLWAQQRVISEQMNTLATKDDLKAMTSEREAKRRLWDNVAPSIVSALIVGVILFGLTKVHL